MPLLINRIMQKRLMKCAARSQNGKPRSSIIRSWRRKQLSADSHKIRIVQSTDQAQATPIVQNRTLPTVAHLKSIVALLIPNGLEDIIVHQLSNLSCSNQSFSSLFLGCIS